MAAELLAGLSARGCAFRVVSVRRLTELKREIETRHHRGLFDEDFYREWVSGFDSSPPESMPQARSIILVAVQERKKQITFTWNGREHPLLIPPTYFEAPTRARLQRLLSELLRTRGYGVSPASLPKKLLAVRSGLAEYGKNNLSYIPGMGSAFGLEAFYSELPPEADPWGETRFMERCGSCSECRRRCPTGAIPAEGFLIRAERCLSLHNEQPSSTPFPSWIDPSWHNCLIGCLRCQEACPANRGYLDQVDESLRVSESDTRRLLQTRSARRLPVRLRRTFERSDLLELLEVLPRNLRVLIAAGQSYPSTGAW
jgi:epoxyqueuosine reductase